MAGWRFERRPAFSYEEAHGWTRFYKDGTVKDLSYGYDVAEIGYWKVLGGVVHVWDKRWVVPMWMPAPAAVQQLYSQYLNKVMLCPHEDSPWSRFANKVTGWWYGVAFRDFPED